jgi:transposase-like protein
VPKTNKGGPTPGAGRKPGPVDYSVEVDGSETGLNPPKVTSLEGPALLAVQLYVQGITKSEIARRMGKDRHTIDRWLTENAKLITQEVRKYSAVDHFLPHVPAAVATTVEVMEKAKPQTRLMAAQTVLDEAFGKTVVRSEHKSHAVIQITYRDHDDEEQVIEGKVVEEE